MAVFLINSRLGLLSAARNSFKHEPHFFRSYVRILPSRVTPLACSFRLVCTDSEAYTNSHMDEIVDACFRGMETAAVTLSDGTVLDGAQLSLGSSGIKAYPVTLYWSLSFCCPLDPDAVRSLSLFGDTVDFAE